MFAGTMLTCRCLVGIICRVFVILELRDLIMVLDEKLKDYQSNYNFILREQTSLPSLMAIHPIVVKTFYSVYKREPHNGSGGKIKGSKKSSRFTL